MLRALVVLALLTTTASAESWPASITSLEIRIEDRRIEATVVGIERKMPIFLRDGDRSVEPMIVRSFNQGKPLALMLVVEGNELAMSSDMLQQLQYAVDNAGLGSILPPDSQAAVISYAERAQLVVAWKRAEELIGMDVTLAVQQLQAQWRTGNNLYDAVNLAIEMLAVRPEPHKLMIVIGDGSAPTGDRADAALRELRDRAKGIEIVALVVPHASSPDEISIDELTDRARQSAGYELSKDFKEAFDVATHRFEATFDLTQFVRDGQEHTLRLTWGDTELGRARIKMPGTPPPSKTWRWLVVGGVVVAFGLMSLLMFRSQGRR